MPRFLEVKDRKGKIAHLMVDSSKDEVVNHRWKRLSEMDDEELERWIEYRKERSSFEARRKSLDEGSVLTPELLSSIIR